MTENNIDTEKKIYSRNYDKLLKEIEKTAGYMYKNYSFNPFIFNRETIFDDILKDIEIEKAK